MQQTWRPVTTLPPLRRGELQVWRIALPVAPTEPGPYTGILTPDEAAHAARLREGDVRLQFIVARGALRILLGNLLALPTNRVVIETGAYGKPATSGLHFNLAHTARIILIALSRESEIGVDVEHMGRDVEALELARNYFSINETRALESISEAGRLQQAFFRCWTRKEAIVKADGRGLSLPLASFDVPVVEEAASTPVHVVRSAEIASAHKTFYLSDLSCGEEFAAALAFEVPDPQVRLFDFPPKLIPSFTW